MKNDFAAAAFTLLLFMFNFAFTQSRDSHADSDNAKHAFLPPTTFGPGGRLDSVQVAAQTALLDDRSNNLVAAIHCRDGVVVVASLPESPYFPTNLTTTKNGTRNVNETSSSAFTSLLLPETGVARPPFSRLSTTMWAVTAGNYIDSQLLRLRLQRLAETIRDEDQGDRPDVLSRRLADNLQLLTQESGHGRILAAFALIFTDDEIWRVDPTGQFWKCSGAVIGRNCASVESQMLSRLDSADGNGIRQKTLNMSRDEILALCASCVAEEIHRTPEHLSDSDRVSTQNILNLKGFWVSRNENKWFSEDDLRKIANLES